MHNVVMQKCNHPQDNWKQNTVIIRNVDIYACMDIVFIHKNNTVFINGQNTFI
jgi:hypothetical protein